MGRFQRRRKNKGSKKQRDDGGNKDRAESYVLAAAQVGNFKMESYYAAQGLHNSFWNEAGELVPCTTDEEKLAERSKYKETASKILPSSFRIGRDVPPVVRQQMELELQELLESSKTEEFGQVLFKIPFLANAYQLNLDRTTIRKNPKLADLHGWLKNQTAAGFISRQETVSMIPTTILAVQPSDLVLDMCAAPGSKSSQLLEDLGPKGCLVANDSNYQRAHMLVHQLKRIQHLNPVLLVTNCDGQVFPSVTQFDKILCDVPCSGDGTTRKNIGIWKRWSQMAALALHRLQVNIAWRGLQQLLKVDGMMVYSTCSLNPIENEAVVAELLRRSEGGLELVACELKGFKTRPGISDWKVMCEEKSRLEMKNEWKKNNPKMQAKREQLGDKKEQDASGDTEVDVATKASDAVASAETGKPEEAEMDAATHTAESNGDKEEGKYVGDGEAAETKPAPTDGENTELNADKAKAKKAFEPTTMAEDSLIEMTKEAGFRLFDSFSDVPTHLQSRLRPSAFPPTPEEVAQFHLELCHRCLPQDNNTGGFFVALFRKVKPLSKVDRRAGVNEADSMEAEDDVSSPKAKKARVENEDSLADDDEAVVEEDDLKDLDLDDENKPSSAMGGSIKGNLMKDEDGNEIAGVGKDDFMPLDDEKMNILIDFYGLDESTFHKDQCMTRACGEKKVVYYIGRPVKDLIDLGIQQRVTIVNSGLKAFTRNNNNNANVPYRICQEAIQFLEPSMTKRKVVANLDDITKCYGGMSLSLTTFSDAFAEKVRPMGIGAFIVVLDGYEEQIGQKLIASMWRARGDNIDCCVAKVEIEGVQTKLKAIASITEKS